MPARFTSKWQGKLDVIEKISRSLPKKPPKRAIKLELVPNKHTRRSPFVRFLYGCSTKGELTFRVTPSWHETKGWHYWGKTERKFCQFGFANSVLPDLVLPDHLSIHGARAKLISPVPNPIHRRISTDKEFAKARYTEPSAQTRSRSIRLNNLSKNCDDILLN